MRIFIGMDERQPIAANVLAHSIERRASKATQITKLQLRHMPIKRRGLTSFTFSRYCPPYLCGYQGKAVFLDADMLCLGDIFELESLVKDDHPVYVVKNRLRFEWPSLMVFNCDKCEALTPEFIETGEPHTLKWGEVGDLPGEWNHCVGYDEPKPNVKIVHYTQGIPCFPEVENCEFSKEWNSELRHMNSTVSWTELMGKSIHAGPVLKRLGRG